MQGRGAAQSGPWSAITWPPQEATVVLILIALLVPILMMLLMLALSVFEDRIFRPPPPPPEGMPGLMRPAASPPATDTRPEAPTAE